MWKRFKKDRLLSSFKPISLNEYCPTIKYDFAVKNLRDTHLVEILIVAFQGTYRNGSKGKPDAGLIKGVVAAGVSVFDPVSVLLDLRELEYNWGDDFDLSFKETEDRKVAILVGEKCRRGMSTLVFGIDTAEDIVDNKIFFDDFEKAMERLTNED